MSLIERTKHRGDVHEGAPRLRVVPKQRDRRTGPWQIADPFLRAGIRPLLVGADLLACLLSVAVFGHSLVDVLFVMVLLPLLATAGLYRSRLSLSVLDDLQPLVGRWLAALPLTVALQVVASEQRWGDVVVRWDFVLTAVSALAVIVALRALAYVLVRAMRTRGHVSHRTLVVGAGTVGGQVVHTLQQHPEHGLRPIGFLDSDPLLAKSDRAVPLLGGVEDIAQVVVEHDVNNVVLAFARMREAQMVDILRTCDRHRCELFVVPRLFELHPTSDDMDSVWGLPLVRLRRAPYRTSAWRMKRVLDVVLAAGAVAVMGPLMLAIALAVRIEGGPGVLFRQERIGVDGRSFQLLKFRSMKPATDQEAATTWNIAHDDRLAPVGRFLRKSSLDELPQLFNILAGAMSVVGPRPERPHFVEQFQRSYPSYMARHRVPSGLTGWAQVNGLRGDTSIADRARFDNYYIENWSLWLDLKIVLRTFGSVLRGTGA